MLLPSFLVMHPARSTCCLCHLRKICPSCPSQERRLLFFWPPPTQFSLYVLVLYISRHIFIPILRTFSFQCQPFSLMSCCTSLFFGLGHPPLNWTDLNLNWYSSPVQFELVIEKYSRDSSPYHFLISFIVAQSPLLFMGNCCGCGATVPFPPSPQVTMCTTPMLLPQRLQSPKLSAPRNPMVTQLAAVPEMSTRSDLRPTSTGESAGYRAMNLQWPPYKST